MINNMRHKKENNIRKAKRRLLFKLKKFVPDIKIEILNVNSLYPGAIVSFTLSSKCERGYSEPIIYMPKDSLLNTKTVDFVALHEIGHIINIKKHFLLKKNEHNFEAKYSKSENEIYYQYDQIKEFDADDFAVKVQGLYKTVQMMREYFLISLKKFSVPRKPLPPSVFKLKYRLLRLESFLKTN